MGEEEKNMEKRILKVAEDLFLEQGFAKTTMGQIAKSADCNQALVHYYYRKKENLFDKIFEEKARLLFSNILNVESAGTSFEEKLRMMIEAHFDFLRQDPRLLPFILIEIMSNPARRQALVDKVRQYPKTIFAQIEPRLRAEIEKGNIRPISLTDLLLTVISLNIAPFFIMPVIQKTAGLSDTAVDAILEKRKKEVVETVLSRIKK